MTDIPTPQSLDADTFAIGLDEDGNLIGSQIDESQISYAVLGEPTTSTTEMTVSTGIKTCTLDFDNGIAVDDPVRIESLDDPVCWMYGICTARDETISPVAITVLVYRISDLTLTGSNWQIQRTPNFAALFSSTLGYSSDSLEFGAGNDIFVGATVSITTDSGDLLTPGSHIIVAATSDGSQYFRGISQSYNSATGALSLFVTDVGPSASGIYATWSVVAQDGPGINTRITGTSSSSITVATTSISFTTQAAKDFSNTSLGYLQSLDGTKTIYGQFGSYNSGSGSWSINPMTVSGSGTDTSWVVVQQTPPLAIDAVHGFLALFNAASGLSVISLAGDNKHVTIRGQGTAGSNQSLLFDMHGADRTVSLSGDITVSSATTVSGTNTGDQDISGKANTVTTTRGDIITRGASADQRVALGASGTIVSSDGTDTVFQTPLVLGLPVLVASGTFSGANTASIDFSSVINSTVKEVIVKFIGVTTATDNVSITGKVSANGSSFDGGSNNYKYAGTVNSDADGPTADNSSGNTSIGIITADVLTTANGVGNGAAEGCYVDVRFAYPGNSAFKPRFLINADWYSANDHIGGAQVTGLRNTAQVTKGFQLKASSGNIAGAYEVWIKK